MEDNYLILGSSAGLTEEELNAGFKINHITPEQALKAMQTVKHSTLKGLGYSVIQAMLEEFDERGVRIFVGYQRYNGKFCVDLYRKKTESELTGKEDWRMVYVSHTQSYFTRKEATMAGIIHAEKVCEEFGF